MYTQKTLTRGVSDLVVVGVPVVVVEAVTSQNLYLGLTQPRFNIMAVAPDTYGQPSMAELEYKLSKSGI